MNYFAVLTSDGEVHETDSEEEYVNMLDEFGPEVVSSVAEDITMVHMAIRPDLFQA